MSEIEIVKMDRSEEASWAEAMPPEQGNRFVLFMRNLMRRLGLMEPYPEVRYRSAFQENLVLYRFESADGRAAVITVTKELEADASVDVEALAREDAIRAMERMEPRAA